MEQTKISYKDTDFFSSIVNNYLNNNLSISKFYNQAPSIENFGELINQRKSFSEGIRQTLVSELEKQYNNISATDWVKANIQALANENTFTVCTGHQLCLASGPLYFIYKIASTIKLAKQITERYPHTKVVPVFWMATEDHDFEEINHINLFGKKLTFKSDAKGATGRIPTQGIDAFVNSISEILGEKEVFANKTSELLKKSYVEHDNLADATRYFVNELFGEYGLVIIDADRKELKKFFAPTMFEDITNNHSYKLISETNKQLEAEGVHVQVNPREINFFYLDNNLRERIIFEDNKYKVLNTSIEFTKEELLKEIASNPKCFSPNVLMRPVYQETILPNLAYIGGGAEVNYWLQLKSTFDFYNGGVKPICKSNFPILILRNSALVVDKTSDKRFSQLGFDLGSDIFKDTNELVNKFVASQTTNELSLEQEIAEFESVFASLIQKTTAIDASLLGSLEAEKTKFYNSLKGFESKLNKAEKKKFELQTQQINTIKEKLFPNGSLQERYDNFLPYYIREGQDWIKMLIESFDPLEGKFTIFH